MESVLIGPVRVRFIGAGMRFITYPSRKSNLVIHIKKSLTLRPLAGLLKV
jgi:hypothetical protein